MTREEASNRLKQWIRNGCDGMTDERLGYIEGWFHKSDKEAFEQAIKALEQEPSGDLISRQELLEDLYKRDYTKFTHRDFVALVQYQDTVQQEPKTGHWIIKDGKEQGYDIGGIKTWYIQIMCDKCGFIKTAIEGHTGQYHYCPNCGARMVEPQESGINNEKEI